MQNILYEGSKFFVGLCFNYREYYGKILQSEVQDMSRMVIVVNMLERFHCFSKEILVSEEQLLHFHFWFLLNKIDQFDEGL